MQVVVAVLEIVDRAAMADVKQDVLETVVEAVQVLVARKKFK